MTKNELNNLYVNGTNTVSKEYLSTKFGEENLCCFGTEQNPLQRKCEVYKCDYDFIKERYADLVANNGLSFNFFILGKTSALLRNAKNDIRASLKFEKTGTLTKRRVKMSSVKITIEEVVPTKKSRARKKFKHAH